MRTGNKKYLENIIKSSHGSVLEHTWLNWMIADVSRVFTHEVVRHRVGTAISQQSQRYVRHNNINFFMPSDMQEIINTSNGSLTIKDVDDAKSVIVDTLEYLEQQAKSLSDIFKLDDSSTSFDIKKRLTTIVRRILPNGGLTNIGWSCNIRTLRHVLEARTSRHAEEEIRRVFGIIGSIVIERYPNLFADYKIEIINGLPEFTTEFPKI